MCMHQKIVCDCGEKSAYLFHRDDILPEEVVVSIYCPNCKAQSVWNDKCMIEDNNWRIEYDMEAAAFYLQVKGIEEKITPDYIFDQEYCSWYGMTPVDLDDNIRIHNDLKSLQQNNLLEYMNTLKSRRLSQFKELKKAGWRKAQKI